MTNTKNLTDSNISLLQKFVERQGTDAHCYTVSGRVFPSGPKMGINILYIGHYRSMETIGEILNGLGHFGGSVIFQQNYGANMWMQTGQIDLIVALDTEAGEADWLGKCYDAGRKSNAPLCVEFLVGRECGLDENFKEKFTKFMKDEFYSLRNALEAEPSKERVRKLTDPEIGWKGKEFLAELVMSKGLASYLQSIGMTDPKLVYKGTVRDLVYNFVMMVDGKPTFAATENQEFNAEIKFILEQLGYLPRPKIERGAVQIDLNAPLSDDAITTVLAKSIDMHAHQVVLNVDKKEVRIIRGKRPNVTTDKKFDVVNFNFKNLRKLIDGKTDINQWFEDGHHFDFSSSKTEESPQPVPKRGLIKGWIPKMYEYRDIIVDRELIEMLIKVEEATCIPHFAYEALHGSFYGKKSMIPLQQIA
ncbi:MAG: hypothetical protein WDN09_03780 [bacterium]